MCLGEFTRHLSPATLLPKLRVLCFTQLRADLAAVFDCTDPAVMDISEADLLREGDYTTGQALARAAREHGAEARLLPSATRIGEPDARVLIVFPDTMRPGSAVRIVKTVRPTLAPPAEVAALYRRATHLPPRGRAQPPPVGPAIRAAVQRAHPAGVRVVGQ